jgi:signal transduction histidine kinase
MKPSDAGYLNVGTRLTLTFALLIVLILGGNGLVVWQFNLARTQSDRLAGANQQMIVVLQLQVNLLSFHQRLDDLAGSRGQRLVAEAQPLRRALHEQTQRTRSALALLPPETRVDPAFWPTLEAIEIILPAQLDAITELARAGDWAAVQLRLGNQLKPIETQTAILVDSVDRQASRDLMEAVEQMRTVQRRILILVPATAICSFLIAAFFGWSMARRIMELRLNERVAERMRIAHELHDTLLQTIQASRIVAGLALETSSDPTPERQALQKLSEWLEKAVQEGRAALNSLRTSATGKNDLAEALRRAIVECRRPPAEVSFSVAGDPRDMHPVVRDEIYRIGYEAIRNACQHAQASRVEVELRYAQDLALSVRDNGVGIEPALIKRGKPGHFGLQGMRERASRIGGRLTLASAAVSGTEIQLVVPGGIIFRNTNPARIIRLAKLRNLFSRLSSTSKAV